MGRVLAVFVSAVAYGALCFPPWAWSWLAWIVLVPLLLVLRGSGPLKAFIWTAGWGYLATISVIAWLLPTLTGHFEWSQPLSLGFIVGFGVVAAAPFYGLGGVLYGAAARRHGPLAGAVLFAACWVVGEFARTHLGFRTPWALLGDSQAEAIRIRQLADLGGVYLVTAMVAFVNACLAELILVCHRVLQRSQASPRLALPVAGAAVAVLLASNVYGELRRRQFAPTESAFKVALVQGNVPPQLRWRSSTASHVVRRYGSLTRNLLLEREEPDPDLILWPENAIQTPLDHPTYGAAIQRVAMRSPVLLGAPRNEVLEGSNRAYNSAVLVDASGTVGSYDKRRLLPFSETRPLGDWLSLGERGDLDAGSYSAGQSPGLFAVNGEMLGVLICMEGLYPDLSREAVLGGASLLINLSNDGWYRGLGGAEQHLRQVVFRAIENRRPLLRATTTGISAIVGPDGSIVASLPQDATGVLEHAVPETPVGLSPYTRAGDLFAWSCVAIAGFAARPRQKKSDSG
ncbi:MAG: apolipoprotein N-acyltransferase [bacterium]|nr:apolipoprotein N-acyltransferase [bacterium]